MNEQLQQAVSNLIQTSLVAFEKGATFLNDQIPEVVQQLLLWHGLQSFLTFFVFGILGTITLIFWIKYQIKFWFTPTEKTNYYGDKYIYRRFDEGYGGLSLLNLVLIIPICWVILVSLCNLTWLQIWIAPKLYLLEYATKIFK